MQHIYNNTSQYDKNETLQDQNIECFSKDFFHEILKKQIIFWLKI